MTVKTKKARTRVDDTVDYIVGRVPALEQNAVRAYLDHFVTAFGNGPGFRAMSNEMTMTNVNNPGNEAARERKRALMLLQIPTTTFTGAVLNSIRAKADALVQTELTEAIRRLCYAADGTHGTGQKLQVEFETNLKGRPRAWLDNNKVRSKDIAARPKGYFHYDITKNQFILDASRPGTVPHAWKFPAVTIPAVVWSAVPGRTANQTTGSFAGIVGTELTGATSMISTMFSGCSFCFKVVGPRIFAAHIMPDDGMGSVVSGGGDGLARQLAGQVATVTAGDFAAPCPGGGNFQVYGAGYSNIAGYPNGYPPRAAVEQYMNIFGNCKAGVWKIYAQHVLNDTVAAVRIY